MAHRRYSALIEEEASTLKPSAFKRSHLPRMHVSEKSSNDMPIRYRRCNV
jgi:hypothetical protein